MNTLDVDQIVREVVAALKERPKPSAKEREDEKTIENRDDCVLRDAKLISLASLAGRLEGKRRLIVAQNAVLTPSAKDELRKRRIEIIVAEKRKSGNSEQCDENDARRLVRCVAIDGIKLPGGLSKPLQMRFGLEIENATEITGLLKFDGNGRIVVFVREAAKATRILNQTACVRAVRGVEPRQCEKDIREIDANILVLDPHETSVYRVLEMVAKFIVP